MSSSGATMSGKLALKQGAYADEADVGALDLRNSNILNVNSIYTADSSEGASEGIHFKRSDGNWDTLWMNSGRLLFTPNRAYGSTASVAESRRVGCFKTAPTSGNVVVADGTGGGMITSDYTIAKSVPSSAVFTDKYVDVENASTSMGNEMRLIFTSNATTSGTYNETLYKVNQISYRPADNQFKVTSINGNYTIILDQGKDIKLTGTTWDGSATSLKTALNQVVTEKDFTCTAATVSANSSKQFATVNVALTGYLPIGFGKYNTGDGSLVPVNLYLEGNNAIFVVRNVSGSAISATPTFRIIYRKTS